MPTHSASAIRQLRLWGNPIDDKGIKAIIRVVHGSSARDNQKVVIDKPDFNFFRRHPQLAYCISRHGNMSCRQCQAELDDG